MNYYQQPVSAWDTLHHVGYDMVDTAFTSYLRLCDRVWLNLEYAMSRKVWIEG